jgi:hypothetical protein
VLDDTPAGHFKTSTQGGKIVNVNTDELSVINSGFAALDDSALLTWRAEVRAELERLPPHSPGHAELAARYDRSTQEIDDRARRAWAADAKRSGP